MRTSDHEVLAPLKGRSETVIVVADGLSATAVMAHAAPLLVAIDAQLGLRAPVVIAQQARVGIGAFCTGASIALGMAMTLLDAGERQEEIARMLSGAEVTPEARAQADRLLEGV